LFWRELAFDLDSSGDEMGAMRVIGGAERLRVNAIAVIDDVLWDTGCLSLVI
jgi:hypothetical protein